MASEKTVWSHNEWDPLEEVIVGTIEGVAVPVLTYEMKTMIRRDYWDFYLKHGGKPYPPEMVKKAAKALNNLQEVLEGEGVIVKRPDRADYAANVFKTPFFQSSGFFNADVRDVLVVIGDEIVEAPMAFRPRYFEYLKYRSLIQEYFKKGARWTAAPKCSMSDALYDWDYPEEFMTFFRGDPNVPDNVGPLAGRYITTESEPCFDAADIARFGKDILCQRSQVTNDLGIQWLERHLGEQYRIRRVKFRDPAPVHIDATWVPIGEGRVLSCPDRVCLSEDILEMFKKARWEILFPPEGVAKADFHLSSRWLSMNILVIDEERVLVEKHEEPTIKFFKEIGLKPVTVDFKDHYVFGGGLHCSTCDIRRRGDLKSYF
ncbi:MAG: NarL family transcriptional regulator [Desulfobacteraceae bacterium]|nr:NarL family transcriptional regulator [Desulfobacteraceae bacterium]